MASPNVITTDEARRWNGERKQEWMPGEAVDSRLLLGGSHTVRIVHGTEVYTLRETRAGKLILTK
ncbi:MAG: hemin uptake protein HemP [Pseudomonadota bacterium]